MSRARVPGGWLVLYSWSYEIPGAPVRAVGGAGGGGVAFVPDPDHAWDSGSVK